MLETQSSLNVSAIISCFEEKCQANCHEPSPNILNKGFIVQLTQQHLSVCRWDRLVLDAIGEMGTAGERAEEMLGRFRHHNYMCYQALPLGSLVCSHLVKPLAL